MIREDSGRWIYDPVPNDMSPDASGNIASIRPILEAHGFGDRWGFRGCYPGGQCYGMTEQQITQLYRDADAFLNLTGAQEIREEHLRYRRRMYVESDPFAAQVRVSQGNEKTIELLAGHDTYFSFGENLSAPDCDVPIERFQWLPTRQPVDLDLWENPYDTGSRFTTITTWHNKGNNVSYRGDLYYWTKDREFEKFLDLPRRRNVGFELAAGVGKDIQDLLSSNGWLQVDSLEMSRDPSCYRSYIEKSRKEFTVARDQYVRPKTGWFSDRSACYLAAGRPVVAHETGFSKFLPTGKGLFGFATLDDILGAVDEIESNYQQNSRAAREIVGRVFLS